MDEVSCLSVSAPTRVRLYVHPSVYPSVSMCVFAFVSSVSTCSHACVCVCAHACMHACVCACMSACLFVRVCYCSCMYANGVCVHNSPLFLSLLLLLLFVFASFLLSMDATQENQ